MATKPLSITSYIMGHAHPSQRVKPKGEIPMSIQHSPLLRLIKKPCATLFVLSGAMAATQTSAQDLTEVTLGTSWYAQAEHGGFYQAKADGIYEDYGLDVNIEMGGPQVNGLQLLAAGKVDFQMGYSVRAIDAQAEGVPITTVAASFQKDPQVLITHKDITSFEDIKGRETLISTSARQTYWPWLKNEYGFTDEMAQPYQFSLTPFLEDDEKVMQGYLSSEPFALQEEGADINVYLLADQGYPNYSATIETREEMVEEQPEVVEKFVKASMEGWASYFENPEPGNELIKKDNPDMEDEQIEYAMEKMRESEMLTADPAAENGIGTMTHERWEEIFEFMEEADMVLEDTDYKDAYTLEFLPDDPIKMQ